MAEQFDDFISRLTGEAEAALPTASEAFLEFKRRYIPLRNQTRARIGRRGRQVLEPGQQRRHQAIYEAFAQLYPQQQVALFRDELIPGADMPLVPSPPSEELGRWRELISQAIEREAQERTVRFSEVRGRMQGILSRIAEIDEQLIRPTMGYEERKRAQELQVARAGLTRQRNELSPRYFDLRGDLQQIERTLNLLGGGEGLDRNRFEEWLAIQGVPRGALARNFGRGRIGRLSRLFEEVNGGNQIAETQLQAALVDHLSRKNRQILNVHRNYARLIGSGVLPADDHSPGGTVVGDDGTLMRVMGVKPPSAMRSMGRVSGLDTGREYEETAGRFTVDLGASDLALPTLLSNDVRYTVIDELQNIEPLHALRAQSRVFRDQFGADAASQAYNVRAEDNVNAEISRRIRRHFKAAGDSVSYERHALGDKSMTPVREMMSRITGSYRSEYPTTSGHYPNRAPGYVAGRAEAAGAVEAISPGEVAEELFMGSLLGRPPRNAHAFGQPMVDKKTGRILGSYQADYDRYLGEILNPQRSLGDFEQQVRQALLGAVPGLEGKTSPSEIQGEIEKIARQIRVPGAGRGYSSFYFEELERLRREGQEAQDLTLPLHEAFGQFMQGEDTEAAEMLAMVENPGLREALNRELSSAFNPNRLQLENQLSMLRSSLGLSSRQTENLTNFLVQQMNLPGEFFENPFFGRRGEVVQRLRTLTENRALLGLQINEGESIPFMLRGINESEEGDILAHMEFVGSEAQRRAAAEALYGEGLRRAGMTNDEVNARLTQMIADGWTGDRIQYKWRSMVDTDPATRSLMQLEAMSKKDLTARARQLQLRGFSRMNKAELAQAVLSAEGGAILTPDQARAVRRQAELMYPMLAERYSASMRRPGSAGYRTIRLNGRQVAVPEGQPLTVEYVEELLRAQATENLSNLRPLQRVLGEFGEAEPVLSTGNVSRTDVDLARFRITRAIERATQPNMTTRLRHQQVVQSIGRFMDRNRSVAYRGNKSYADRESYLMTHPAFAPSIRENPTLTRRHPELYEDVFGEMDETLNREFGMSLGQVRAISESTEPLKDIFAGVEGRDMRSFFQKGEVSTAEIVVNQSARNASLYMPLSPFGRVALPGAVEYKQTQTMGELMQLAYLQRAMPDEFQGSLQYWNPVTQAFEHQEVNYARIMARAMGNQVEKMRNEEEIFKRLPIALQKELVKSMPVADPTTTPKHLMDAYFENVFKPAMENMWGGYGAGPKKPLTEIAESTAEQVAREAPRNPRNVSLESLRGVINESNYLKYGSAALLGIGVLGLARAIMKRGPKDRTKNDLNGPPHLPGGNPYDNVVAPGYIQTAVGLPGYAPYGGGGITYQVNARGDFDPAVLQSRIEAITGSNVSGTIYDTPADPSDRSRTDAILRNYR